MNIFWVLGAAVGAVLGAILWAGITWATHLEVGYVAWAIGGMVGFGAYLLGGKGSFAGASCAVLALFSILLGKALACQVIVKRDLRKALEAQHTMKLYKKSVEDAAAFSQLKEEKDYRSFMVQHEYSAARKPEEVPAEELEDFKEYDAPMLEKLHREKPDFNTWREEGIELELDRTMRNVPLIQAVVSDLGAMDLLFGFLGVATAFRVGSGQLKRKSKPAAEGSG